MNRQVLHHFISEYKRDFDRVNQYEIYKWKAVKCFQDNWNIDTEDFHEMLALSFASTKNLMDSGQYFPRRMLIQYAQRNPNELRELFRSLFDEEEDLYTRIVNFQKGINLIHAPYFQNKSSYQDARAVIVYLTLRYPERYFFYKFEMFKQFSKILELSYKPIMGRLENVGHFNSISELIRYELSLDQELLKLHKDRITSDCYYDENLNILTQDFIYAVTIHLHKEFEVTVPIAPENIEITTFSTDLVSLNQPLSFQGRIINFLQNQIENKRLGDLGELWVMKYEANKLIKANRHSFVHKIKHTAKDEGDGTGYDIQSYDNDGNEIFIEVKTTKGGKSAAFYVTRNELERSKKEKENFYLYRLFNYQEEADTADLMIIRGELTKLCEFPTNYKISLEK